MRRAGLGRADAEWAFGQYLGRRPTPEEAREALAAAQGDAESLRRHIALREDALRRAPHSPPAPAGRFYAWEPGAPRVVILGNCQGPNLARRLHALSERPLSIIGLDITTFQQAREEFMLAVEAADMVLATATPSAEFAEISAPALRQGTRAQVMGHIPIHFGGLHPDITYLGARGQRVASPIGDYHSRILLRAFLRGTPPAEARALLEDEATYEELGLFNTFAEAEAEWQRREKRLVEGDLSIRDWFFERVREQPLLYSSNHPTGAVLDEIIRRFCAQMGLPCSGRDSFICPSTFTFGATWPVLPVLAGRLGLRYGTPHLYANNTFTLGAAEFTRRSYDLYGSYQRDMLEECARAWNVAF